MSLIYVGMDTDKFEKDFFVLHCTRLQERIAELEAQSKSRSDTIIEYSNKIAKLEVKLTSANNIIKIMYMGEDDE